MAVHLRMESHFVTMLAITFSYFTCVFLNGTKGIVKRVLLEFQRAHDHKIAKLEI